MTVSPNSKQKRPQPKTLLSNKAQLLSKTTLGAELLPLTMLGVPHPLPPTHPPQKVLPPKPKAAVDANESPKRRTTH